MEENKAPMPGGAPKKEREFVDDMPHKFKTQFGKSVATSLTGFIAGAAVAAVILVPWMFFLGRVCQADPSLVLPPTGSLESEQAPVNAPLPQ